VGNVVLPANAIQRSVPQGTRIEVTIQINASRLMVVDAFVPLLHQHFSDRLYVPQREEQDFSDLSHKVALDTQTYRERLEQLEHTSSDVDDESTQTELEDLRRDLDQLTAKVPPPNSTPGGVDPDDARRIVEASKTVRGRISRLERRTAGRRNALDNIQWAQLVEIATEVVEKFGTSLEKQQLVMLRRELERVASKGDDKAIQRVCGEIERLRLGVLSKQDWFWREIFDSLRQPDNHFLDPKEARRLIVSGQAAVSRGDGVGLREVVNALWKLQPKDNAAASLERAVRSGLREF